MPSELKIHSLGIVVEDKPRGTDTILVSPIEELNIQPEGKIRESTKKFEGTKPDVDNPGLDTKHEAKNFLTARWYPIDQGNRTTAPDVIAGETVLILKFGDVNEYFWCDFGREPSLRRLEDVLYSWSDLKEKLKPYDKTSSYWMNVNTKDKKVHFHTAKSDGEPFEYDVIFDTKEGTLTITDSAGNFIKLESPINKLTVNTENEIFINATKNITVVTESTSITLRDNGGNSIKLDSPSGTISLNATSKIELNAPVINESCQSKGSSAGSMNMQASGSLAISGGTVDINAGQVNHNTPLVRNSGNVYTSGEDMAHPNRNPG